MEIITTYAMSVKGNDDVVWSEVCNIGWTRSEAKQNADIMFSPDFFSNYHNSNTDPHGYRT